MTRPPAESPEVLREMLDHIASVREIYRPSSFWQTFQEKNIGQLQSKGLANFKRTINQNYFNWTIRSVEDNQFRAVLRTFSDYPHKDAFKVVLDGDLTLEGFFDINPLEDPDSREHYRIFLGMLMNFATRSVPNGLGDTLDERELGNPIPARLNGRLISQDLANSIRERNTICAPFEKGFADQKAINFVEIGAGYGRLMDLMLRSAPSRGAIVDIPPALQVSQWYLSTLYAGQKKIFHFRPWTSFASVKQELTTADLAFLTPDQFTLLPDDYFDAGAAISNLAEMTLRQAYLYIHLLSRKVRRAVYIKQWITTPNPVDGYTFRKADFALPAPWVATVDRVDAVQDLFFECLWQRS